MEYTIYKEDPKQYLSSTVLPLVFVSALKNAFLFKNLKAAQSFLTFLRNQGIDTQGFHLGQKPPK